MTSIYTSDYLQEHLQVPDAILPFVQATPRLLPDETDDDYYRLFEMMASEIIPDTDMEWLWSIDLAWLWFDVSRYRRWMNAILSTGRRAALENALAKTDPEALQIGGMNPLIRVQSRQDAEALRLGAKSRDRLTARLEAHGYNADAINALAFMQEHDALAKIERFLASARRQIANMFREVRFHREFTKRANEATQRFLADLKTREQTAIGPVKQQAEPEPS